MNTFETSICSLLGQIAKTLDMQVKQKERELTLLDKVASSLGDIHADMISSKTFNENMRELRFAVRGEV